MRIVVAFAAALLLTGCGAGIGYILDEYRGTEVKAFEVEGEDTYRIFDKPDKSKLMITPSIGAAAGAGVASGLTFHAVDTVPPKPVFERAALGYLESTGRRCRILDAYLLVRPQWEVKYDCRIPAAPAAEAAPQKRKR